MRAHKTAPDLASHRAALIAVLRDALQRPELTPSALDKLVRAHARGGGALYSLSLIHI